VEGSNPVVCSRNVVIKPDVAFDEAIKKDYDVVVCPGGAKGAEHLAAVSTDIWWAVAEHYFCPCRCLNGITFPLSMNVDGVT